MDAIAERTPPNQVFIGTIIHPKRLDELEYLHHAAVFVEGLTGKIVAVDKDFDPTRGLATRLQELEWTASECSVHDTTTTNSGIGDGDGDELSFFFPGFIDTHLHAPQYPNAGIFGKSTLLDWLDRYTFPLEASLAGDPARARRVYGRCVGQTLACGTTCASYYATIDVAATNLLVDICLERGQRALVGRVCMDEARTCPPWYRDESAEESLGRTRACVAHARAADADGDMVRPIITPRFAPSCTAEAMTRLGQLARDEGLRVQTHISEHKSEDELVADMFPRESAAGRGYAGVYDAFGLLSDRTVLAHAIHLTDADARLLADRKAKVSHCPCSNTAITSGAARVRWLLDAGIDVGLGTDMSAGYSPSLLEAARHAILVSRHVAMQGDEKAKLSVEEVLYLATRGGAQCVGLPDKLGAFEVGMQWDAQLIALGRVSSNGDGDGDRAQGNVDLFGWETWHDIVAKWVFNGDDRNTKSVWVKGRLVHERKKKQ